ncbi:MAG: mechanosensitive ion channel family protein, partial [Waddliaceae bacterium]
LLNQSIKTWNTQLANFTQSLQEWFEQSGRIVQRSAELISLGDQEKEKPIYPRSEILQKNIELGQKNLLIIQGLGKEIDESLFLLGVVNEKSAALQGKGVQWLRIAGNFFYDALAGIKEKLGKTLFYIRNQPVTILSLFQFFLIVFVSWWISKILTRTINKIVRRRKGVRKAVIYRLNRLLHYVILVVGLLIALTMIGFDFSNLIIIAGALGVGLGFGLQSIFNNFISGIIILFQSHIKVGDYVELDNGIRGEIREINVRSTVISTNDGIEVLVPNSEMLSNRIINWTLRDPYRRVHVPFSVAYGSDIDEVARVIIEATNKVPSTLQKIGVPEPRVFLSKFGDNSLEMELVVWVNEKWTRRSNKTLSHYLWAIEKALRKHGFVIPFPQRDLHIIGAAKKKGKSKVPPHS